MWIRFQDWGMHSAIWNWFPIFEKFADWLNFVAFLWISYLKTAMCKPESSQGHYKAEPNRLKVDSSDTCRKPRALNYWYNFDVAIFSFNKMQTIKGMKTSLRNQDEVSSSMNCKFINKKKTAKTFHSVKFKNTYTAKQTDHLYILPSKEGSCFAYLLWDKACCCCKKVFNCFFNTYSREYFLWAVEHITDKTSQYATINCLEAQTFKQLPWQNFRTMNQMAKVFTKTDVG